MFSDARCVVKGIRFGEGMRWHEGALWFSDIAGDKVHRYDTERDELQVVAELPSPSGLGFGLDGRIYVVSLGYDLLYGVDPGGPTEVVLDLAAVSGTIDFNDMISDRQGRLYAGSVGHELDMTGRFVELDHSAEPPGDLWLIDTAGLTTPRSRRRLTRDVAGTMTRVATHVGGPNGMVIRPDGRTFVLAELFADRLTEFDIAADGTLSDRRPLSVVRGSDGICGDAEGAIWTNGLAQPASEPRRCGYERVRADVGRAEQVLLDVPEGWHAITSVLGGPDRRTLYMAIARMDVPQWVAEPENWEHKQAEGEIWAVEVEVPGAGWP